jgi:hypothetical protein
VKRHFLDRTAETRQLETGQPEQSTRDRKAGKEQPEPDIRKRTAKTRTWNRAYRTKQPEHESNGRAVGEENRYRAVGTGQSGQCRENRTART